MMEVACGPFQELHDSSLLQGPRRSSVATDFSQCENVSELSEYILQLYVHTPNKKQKAKIVAESNRSEMYIHENSCYLMQFMPVYSFPHTHTLIRKECIREIKRI